MLKVGVPLAAVRPSAQAGIGYGIQLGCDTSIGDCDTDIDPKGEFVGIFGLDLEVWLGSLAVIADGRYELGFNEISNAGSVLTDVKSNSWIIRAGLGLRL